MEKSERRPVSLAGLRLIGAGAALGLALAVPAPPSSESSGTPQPPAAPTAGKDS